MRKFFCLALSLIMVIMLAAPAMAVETDSQQWFSEEPIYSERFIDPELANGKTTIDPNSVGLYNYGERTEIVDVFETKKTVYVTPTGQPSLGYEAAEDAYVFFFHTSGSTVNFSITVDYQNFTYTAETGYTSSSGSGTAYRKPTTAGRYRFDFIKNYVIKTTKIDVYYGGNEYQYTYYRHDPQYSLGYRWVKIG